MTVYKAVANEAVVTLDLAKAMLAGDTIDESLIEKSGWDFECAYDTESYETCLLYTSVLERALA